MADMLGSKVLPERLNEQRRKLRSRLQEIRGPVRERRKELTPGPDVIGNVEERLKSVRQRLAERDVPTGKLPSLGSDSSSGSSGGNSSTSNSSSDDSEQPMT